MNFLGTLVWCRQMVVNGVMAVACCSLHLSGPCGRHFLCLMGGGCAVASAVAASLLISPFAGSTSGVFSANSLQLSPSTGNAQCSASMSDKRLPHAVPASAILHIRNTSISRSIMVFSRWRANSKTWLAYNI